MVFMVGYRNFFVRYSLIECGTRLPVHEDAKKEATNIE